MKLNIKTLFLLDGLGAFLTALLLYTVLRNFYPFFGMPVEILTILSLLACAFGSYSITCFLLLNNRWKTFLLVICIANLLYCILTACLVIYHYQQLTKLGLTYFLIEMGIIGALVFLELHVLKNLRPQ